MHVPNHGPELRDGRVDAGKDVQRVARRALVAYKVRVFLVYDHIRDAVFWSSTCPLPSPLLPGLADLA